MPLTSIDIHEGVYNTQQRQAISSALHQAMKDELGIPEDDRLHVLYEHPEGTMLHDDVIFGVPRTERLMFVTFSFNNRDAATKQKLFSAAIERLREIADVGPDEVMFRVIETESANWWGSGRVVDHATGYDERMTSKAGRRMR